MIKGMLCLNAIVNCFKGSQESDEYEEVPLVDALNGYLPADGASGRHLRGKF